MKRILAVLCGAIALASCSNRGGGIIPPGGGPHAGNATSLPALPVISQFFVQHAGRIEAPNVPLRTQPRFLKRAHGLAPLSSVLPGDLEQVGVAINPGGPYAGIYAAQTAYTNAFVQIGFPAGASGTSSLFAPLIIPSNKSCLGTGEVYSNSGTGTSASFFVVDVCAGVIPFATPMTAAFAQNYTRISPRGVPELLSLVFSTSAVPTGSSVWYAMIYNFAASRWDLIVQKTGVSGNGTGVSTWLSEFVPGQCPSTPPIAADSMYLYNASTGSFEVVAPAMAQTTTSVFTTAPTCYLADGSGLASFAFGVSVPNSSWGSVATPPTPQVFPETSVPTVNSQPYGIAAGPDGNLWFTESSKDKIGHIDSSGTIGEIVIPAGSAPFGISAGQDGNIWFTEGATNKIGRMTLSGSLTEFTVPTLSSSPQGITSGPDGNVWFTENGGNKIGRITPGGTIVEFTIPTGRSGPIAIASGPDGNLWFAEQFGNKIGRITPSGSITEFTIPTAGSTPDGIAGGPDGNVWFTEFGGNKIGRISPSGTIVEFTALTALSDPFAIAAGPDGNLWFTEFDGNRIGRITPTGTIAEFPIPTAFSGPAGITTGPDGNLWFDEQNANKIGRIIP